MSYNNPTSHELRIGPNLKKIATKLQKSFIKETGGEVDFVLVVNSSAARRTQKGSDVPVGSYIANMDRTSSALVMAEMLLKWQMNNDIPSLAELKDAAGNSLHDLMGLVDPDEPDMVDNDTGNVH